MKLNVLWYAMVWYDSQWYDSVLLYVRKALRHGTRICAMYMVNTLCRCALVIAHIAYRYHLHAPHSIRIDVAVTQDSRYQVSCYYATRLFCNNLCACGRMLLRANIIAVQDNLNCDCA